MTNDPLIAGLVGGFLSGSGVLALAVGVLKDKWLSAAKAASDRELEAHKDTLAKSAYVVKARFDTELAAYREVWGALGQVRIKSRGLLFSGKYMPPLLTDPNDIRDYQVKAFNETSKAFQIAHNAALAAIDKHAPFIDPTIRNEAHKITSADMAILDTYPLVVKYDFSTDWFEMIGKRVAVVVAATENVETLIRERLDRILAVS